MKKADPIAPPVKVDTSNVEIQHSSRRTSQQTPPGLTLRPAEPVALDNPMASPLGSRRSAKKGSSLADAYRKATDDVVNDSNRLEIREAEPVVPRSSSKPNASSAVVPKPSLAIVAEPEPVTAEYEEEDEMVAAPAQEEEHLAPIVSSAGLKRPPGLGVRREPDFVPPPTYTPPDVSVPPMPPKTSAVPAKRTPTHVSAETKSAAEGDSATTEVASLQTRRKFRGGPHTSESGDEGKKPPRPQFASRRAYESDEADSPASLARLEMPEVESKPIQLRESTIDAHTAKKPSGITLRPMASATHAAPESPTSDEFLSKLGVKVKQAEKQASPSAKKPKTKLAADSAKTPAASQGRILFLPPEPTPPKLGQQPRLLDVPSAARALPAAETAVKSATSTPPRSSTQATWSAREKPPQLLVKPAFAVGDPSTGASR